MQAYDECGLQQPSQAAATTVATADLTASAQEEEEYTGYNPKIHGNYDPPQPYAQYHHKKRAEEAAAAQATQVTTIPASNTYETTATFNRFNGNFQRSEVNAERHNDFNKAGRQMNAFFDVDAAANSHDGRSLKEERRQQRFTKKEVNEMRKKKKQKQKEKMLAFYKS
jgi:hypothetical protein